MKNKIIKHLNPYNMNILTSIFKGTIRTILIEILDEAVKQNKINPTQRDLIIEVGAELGKIKLKK